MTNFVPVSADEQQAFNGLLYKKKYDPTEFKLEQTEHSPATYGPRVKTIKIFWHNKEIAIYGAADATSWVEQFCTDFNTGLVTQVLEEHQPTLKPVG